METAGFGLPILVWRDRSERTRPGLPRSRGPYRSWRPNKPRAVGVPSTNDLDRRIRVTDFGLARSLREDTPWTAEIEGTVPFMAPEQASSCWGPIDQRT